MKTTKFKVRFTKATQQPFLYKFVNATKKLTKIVKQKKKPTKFYLISISLLTESKLE